MHDSPLILGSSSPLRKMILESSGYNYIVCSPDIDETRYEHIEPIEKVQKIALEKNIAIVARDEYPENIIITADTLCLLPDGTTLPKPRNAEESIQMSLLQSDKTIQAITGMCISSLHDEKREYTIRYSSTVITYCAFSREEITQLHQKHTVTHIASGLGIWKDAPGFSLIKHWNDSYTGALGLPMEIIREVLHHIR